MDLSISGPTPKPSVGKPSGPITAWYRPGTGYLCGTEHTGMCQAMADAGHYDASEDGGELSLRTAMEQGWIQVRVIACGNSGDPADPGYGTAATVLGHGIGPRHPSVRAIVGHAYDAGVLGFRSAVEVTGYGDSPRPVVEWSGTAGDLL